MRREGEVETFAIPVRIYIEDTDAGGIVYYVNYLKFMERARTDFLRSLGFGKRYILASEHMFVVQSLTVDYRLPATLDDELRVTASPVRLGRAFIEFEQKIYRGELMLCRATVKVVCVGRVRMKPAAIPPDLHSALSG